MLNERPVAHLTAQQVIPCEGEQGVRASPLVPVPHEERPFALAAQSLPTTAPCSICEL